MNIIEPNDRLAASKEDRNLVKQEVLQRFKGKLVPKEIKELLSKIDFTEIYSIFKCTDNTMIYKFVKAKIGIPLGVKKAESKHDPESLFPFSEIEAWNKSKERRTI